MSTAHVEAPQPHHFTVSDGTTIYYRHHSHPQEHDACVVLLHSLAMDHSFWHLVAPSIAATMPVICLDVRGHGQSAKPAGPYSIALFARDVKEVVEGLGYSRVIIAGASMGGCISLQFAVDYPELTAALALIDTTSWYGPTAIEDWEKRAQKAQTDGFASMVPFQTSRWFSEKFIAANPEQVQTCIDLFLANDIDAYQETCRAMGKFNLHDEASTVTAPTAIIVGSEDYAAPVAMSEHMHQAISGSTLTVIQEARHLTPLETPNVIIQALQDLQRRMTESA